MATPLTTLLFIQENPNIAATKHHVNITTNQLVFIKKSTGNTTTQLQQHCYAANMDDLNKLIQTMLLDRSKLVEADVMVYGGKPFACYANTAKIDEEVLSWTPFCVNVTELVQNSMDQIPANPNLSGYGKTRTIVGHLGGNGILLRRDEFLKGTNMDMGSDIYVEIHWKKVPITDTRNLMNLVRDYNNGVQLTHIFIPQFCLVGYGIGDPQRPVKEVEESEKLLMYRVHRWMIGLITYNSSQETDNPYKRPRCFGGALLDTTVNKTMLEVGLKLTQFSFTTHVRLPTPYFADFFV